ncbi:MAG: redoxin domain-containing protein [Verrucomicrobia bacterium]|jgi:peroxiredoxin (alkyl hydroperoxide reductase subunit C)|nr:redoxin domain-containing protein [Verrucomicrobiota bacterium]
MSTFVGKPFPNITVKAIDYLGDQFNLNLFRKAQEKNKKILLFWYPKDFTYVCPTEIHAFGEAVAEFEKRNTLVVGASVDSCEVHFAWLSTPRDQGGIEGVEIPLLADTNRNLSGALGILDGIRKETSEGAPLALIDGDNVTYRATYLIDEEGVVFHEGINTMPLGRNVEEYIRMVDAYTRFQEKGEVCPANWKDGDEMIEANRESVSSYLGKK